MEIESRRVPQMQFSDWLAEAKSGSRDAMGQLLDACRSYLLLIANQELASGLRSKLGGSDIVQETFVDAQRDFRQFRGNNERELLAWLRRLLINNLLNQTRFYRGTLRRDLSREVPWESSMVASQSGVDPSPSHVSMAAEEQQLVDSAMQRLPEHYQEVLTLRHQQRMSFVEIGLLKGQSPDAIRMLWWRAYERLVSEIDGKG